MNSKSTFVVVLICGVMLTALIARNGDMALLTAPLIVYLLAGILECPTELRLQAQRTIEKGEVVAERPVKIRIVVENQGQSMPNLYLADGLADGVMLSGGQAQQRL